MENKEIEKLKELWTIRNPQHEINSNTGKDMFWETVLCIFNDMQSHPSVEGELTASEVLENETWKRWGSTFYNLAERSGSASGFVAMVKPQIISAMEVYKNRLSHPSIDEAEAVWFAEWLMENDYDNFGTKPLWKIWCGNEYEKDKRYTTSELHSLYLKTKGGNDGM